MKLSRGMEDALKISDDFVMQVATKLDQAKDEDEQKELIKAAIGTVISSTFKLLDLLPDKIRILTIEHFIAMLIRCREESE